MLKINDEFYRKLATELLHRIENENICTVSIELDFQGIDYKFIATIIPYYRQDELDGRSFDTLFDIVPVWWELQSYTLNGLIYNDFDFELLKNEVCQC